MKQVSDHIHLDCQPNYCWATQTGFTGRDCSSGKSSRGFTSIQMWQNEFNWEKQQTTDHITKRGQTVPGVNVRSIRKVIQTNTWNLWERTFKPWRGTFRVAWQLHLGGRRASLFTVLNPNQNPVLLGLTTGEQSPYTHQRIHKFKHPLSYCWSLQCQIQIKEP